MFFLSHKAARARLREAEHARRNRLEIVKALSDGQITRRDLLKMGIMSAGGLLLPIQGLSPFAKSAYASGGSNIPTGVPTSPCPHPTDKPYTQPLLRCHSLTRYELESTGGHDAMLTWPGASGEDAPAMRRANTTAINHKVRLATADNAGNAWVTGTTGPMEGRPPGEAFAHQRWDELVNGYKGSAGADGRVSHPFKPVGTVMSLGQIAPNLSYNLYNNWTAQDPSKVWTFAEGKFQRGAFPPILLQARYGETVINRIYNNLPFWDPEFNGAAFPNKVNSTNGGWGRQEPAIHNHNGHNGCESDGAQNAHFFPGQYYDYNYSLMLARRDAGLKDSKNRDLDALLKVHRGDIRCSTPTDGGGIVSIPGDFREIQGTLWFHDHRISFTSENVYKGYCALLEYFSGPDRGYERALDDADANKANLRLPSGWRNGKTWGNRDFDVYLAIQDVAFDQDEQLYFDIFDTDGFLGDVMHVNYQWKPTLDVLPRKYRIRTLSAGMSRWVKLAVVDSLDPNNAKPVPITVIANDGNVFPRFVRNVAEMDVQGTAERYDFVIDFSAGQRDSTTGLNAQVGKTYYLVNLCEHSDGKGPKTFVSIQEALAGKSDDPCVGAIMQFKVASQVRSIDDPRAMNTIDNACGARDRSWVRDPDAIALQHPEMKEHLWEIPTVEPVRTRVIELVRGADGGGLPFDHSDGDEPWGIKVNGGSAHLADMRRVSNLPMPGDVEHWTIKSGGGWGHPLHLHFEEAKTLARSSGLSKMERNKRKDVWHVGSVGNVKFQVTFGEFGGAYVNHCHNTVHEDNAMLLRYDLIRGTKKDGSGNVIGGIEDVHITVLPTPDPRPEGVMYVDSCYLREGNPQGFGTGVNVCADTIGPVKTSTDPRTL
jgi:FtsP/CotA-like multicopper oxidase with cupredoxin domain